MGGGDFRVTGGGKGANQAVAAARAGASVVFVTALGTDDIGDRALDSLAAEGIDLRFVRRVPDAPSGIALILVDDAGENVIAVAAGANAALRPEDVEAIETTVEPGDAVLVQLEIPQPTVEAGGGAGAAARGPADPQPGAGATAVRCAARRRLGADAERARGGRARGPRRRRASIRRAWPPPCAIAAWRTCSITLGAAGVLVSSAAGSLRIPAFAGGRRRHHRRRRRLQRCAGRRVDRRPRRSPDAARFASAAAAISVTRPGARASAPHRAEIDAWLLRHPASPAVVS